MFIKIKNKSPKWIEINFGHQHTFNSSEQTITSHSAVNLKEKAFFIYISSIPKSSWSSHMLIWYKQGIPSDIRKEKCST